MKRLFRRHTIADLQSEAHSDERLRRALGPVNLTALGVGAIIGAGIFVLTGTAAAQNAGPAVVLSFALAGVACVFAALCYAEFAALVPVAGSAYTYSYATLGEIFAWIIGWDLILEYAVGAITVAIGWSGYVVSFLNSVGIHLAPELSAARGTDLVQIPAALGPVLRVPAGWHMFSADLGRAITAAGANPAALAHCTAVFNLPAVLIVFIVTTLLVVGIKESATFNNVIVCVKLAVVLLFIVGAAHAINPANWHPFIPPNAGSFGHFGWSGVMMGGGVVFFAYIGFDAVSTAAQEAKNPAARHADRHHRLAPDLHRALPRGLRHRHRRDALHRAGRAGPDRAGGRPRVPGLTRGRREPGAAGDQAGRDRRAVVGRSGDAVGPVARVLQHVPRRPAAAVREPGAPPVQDAVDHLDHHRRRRGVLCRRCCRCARREASAPSARCWRS